MKKIISYILICLLFAGSICGVVFCIMYNNSFPDSSIETPVELEPEPEEPGTPNFIVVPIGSLILSDGSILSYKGSDKYIFIPSSYSEDDYGWAIEGDDLQITSIARRGFYGGAVPNIDGLKAVDLSKTSITTIGEEAFRNQNALTTIYLPSTLKTIEDNAFSGCHRLTEIVVNSYEIYSQLLSNDSCGYLIACADRIRVNSAIDDGSNDYLNSSEFSKSIEGHYNVYTS